MPLPQQPSPRRRPQILDDQTGGAWRFDAHEYEDTWAKDPRTEDLSTEGLSTEDLSAEDLSAEDDWDSGDNSVTRFMARLTDLIRSMGGPK